MLCVGYTVETVYHFWRKERRSGTELLDEELTMTDWREDYKPDLLVIVTGIFEDMQKIKENAESICEQFQDEIEHFKYHHCG